MHGGREEARQQYGALVQPAAVSTHQMATGLTRYRGHERGRHQQEPMNHCQSPTRANTPPAARKQAPPSAPAPPRSKLQHACRALTSRNKQPSRRTHQMLHPRATSQPPVTPHHAPPRRQELGPRSQCPLAAPRTNPTATNVIGRMKCSKLDPQSISFYIVHLFLAAIHPAAGGDDDGRPRSQRRGWEANCRQYSRYRRLATIEK